MNAREKSAFYFLRIALCLVCYIAVLIFLSGYTLAEDSPNAGNRYVKVSIVADSRIFQPPASESAPVGRVGVLFEIEPGWHIYWRNSGEAAVPTQVKWSVPQGWNTAELRWPAPYKFIERGNIITFGYRDRVLLPTDLFAPLIIPSDGETVTIRAKVSWLVCKDICVPGSRDLTATFPFSASEPEEPSAQYPVFEEFDATTPRVVKQSDKFSAVPVLDMERVAPGGSFKLGIILTGFPGKGEKLLGKNIQVFPHTSNDFKFGAASIAQSNNLSDEEIGAGKLANGTFLLTIPVTLSSSVKAGILSLTGTVVISSLISKDLKHISGKPDSDFTFNWSLPVMVSDSGQGSVTTKRWGELQPTLSTEEPLTYRLISTVHSDFSESLDHSQTGQNSTSGLLFALISAFLAGMILNLMPCVLPIISIKIMGFIGARDQPGVKGVRSALAFSSGIVSSFVILAGVIIALRRLGFELGWGFQFQHPAFVFALLLIVFILSLGFFDLFDFSLPYIQGANRKVSKLQHPYVKHFFDGVLATALSTPCTAPFLGTALAFAFAQPPLFTITIFIAIGVGLALPYVLLVLNPRLLSLLPRPGDWMFRFRQLMGFLLLGTVVWLLFVIHKLTEEGVVWSVLILLVVYFAIWLRNWVKSAGFGAGYKVLTDLSLIALIAISVVMFWPLVTTSKAARFEARTSKLIEWQPYSEDLVRSAREQGTPVFIDFTADWCITCKFNERFAIETDRVATALKENGYLALKADWTTGDAVITKALESYGARGVPFYAILPAVKDGKEGAPISLPTILTATSLANALAENVRSSK